MKIILIRQTEDGSVPINTRKSDAAAYRVYTGSGRAGLETAEALFVLSDPPVVTPLLDDAPETGAGFHGWQKKRREMKRRAEQFLDLLEKEERDSVVICGRSAVSALRRRLRARGYLLEGGGLLPRPLERVRATRRSLHCGGCAHNCLLSEAKCQKGQNKAKGIL